MRPSDLHRLQTQIRELVGLHYHPTAAGDPMDPAFLIWNLGPTLAWPLGRYAEDLEAGLPPALQRSRRTV